MRGTVSCRFVGGSKDGEILVIPAMACRDMLSIASDMWMAQGGDGNIKVMKGAMLPRAPWIHFTREIYEKVKPVVPGQVTYRYVRTEEVNRCEKVLEEKGRRCRNEAETGTTFCRVHSTSILTPTQQ